MQQFFLSSRTWVRYLIFSFSFVKNDKAIFLPYRYPGKEWELTAHYFATGQLKCDDALIDKTFPMSRADEAFALYKTPGTVKGKLMLVNED